MLPVWLTDSVTPDLSRAMHYTLLWGLEGVVLRTVGKPGNRVPFVNEQQLRARLTEAELPVVAVDPGLFEGSVGEKAAWLNDLMLLRDIASFCNRIGCGMILSGALAGGAAEFDMESSAIVLREAGEIVHQYGIVMAVRNDAASGCSSGPRLADLVTAVGHPAVSAAWSPAEAVQAGFNPLEGLDAVLDGGRIAMVVVRDGTMDSSGWVDRTPGEGRVGWAAHFDRLAEVGFAGPACLEVRGETPAKQGLAHATALIQQIRLARTATQ